MSIPKLQEFKFRELGLHLTKVYLIFSLDLLNPHML